MTSAPDFHNVSTNRLRSRLGRATRLKIVLSACLTLASIASGARGQAASAPLKSREELTDAAAQAEQSGKALEAAAIRQRLRDGDFQVGDRIVLTFVSDTRHTDTLVVRAGRIIDLPGASEMPVTGLLRSEIKGRVTGEVLNYVKAQEVDVIPLTRIAVLGEVVHPGYFAFRSDVPITDAIMLAGGLTSTAAIERTVVKRQNRRYRSAPETRRAVASGLTLDQFGLTGGDELVVGRRRELINPSLTGVLGIIASASALFLTLRH